MSDMVRTHFVKSRCADHTCFWRVIVVIFLFLQHTLFEIMCILFKICGCKSTQTNTKYYRSNRISNQIGRVNLASWTTSDDSKNEGVGRSFLFYK